MANTTLSLGQLKRAVQIHEQIESLQAELAGLLGGKSVGAKRGRKPGKKAAAEGDVAKAVKEPKAGKKKRTMSPEAREKIAAAQRKRWAKQRKATKE